MSKSIKLVFIDNDRESRAVEMADTIKSMLECCTDLPEELINNMEIIPHFHFLDAHTKHQIIFNPLNIICTSSSYTWNHYNSLGQLLNFLRYAGNNYAGHVYMDTSGDAYDTLNYQLSSNYLKDKKAIQKGINNNYFITFRHDKVERIFARPKGRLLNKLRVETITSLKSLIDDFSCK